MEYISTEGHIHWKKLTDFNSHKQTGSCIVQNPDKVVSVQVNTTVELIEIYYLPVFNTEFWCPGT